MALALTLMSADVARADQNPDAVIGSFRSISQAVQLRAASDWLTVRRADGVSVEDAMAVIRSVQGLDNAHVQLDLSGRGELLVRAGSLTWHPARMNAAVEQLRAMPQFEWALPGARLPNDKPIGFSHEVLVTADDAATPAIAEVAVRFGARITDRLAWDDGWVLAMTDPTRAALLELSAELRRVPGVADAHPNFIRIKEYRATTNDPLLSQQWYLPHIGTFQAWNQTLGSTNVIVAIYDDGFDLNHEDLSAPGKILTEAQWDFGGNDATPDNGEHGTAVAGISIATGNNGKGVAGVCPDCRWLPAKNGYSETDDINAFKHFGDWGAHVVNNSWGYNFPSTSVQNAIHNATLKGRGGLGTMVVFAAGNDNVDIDAIQDISVSPGAIAVSSVGEQDQKRSYSNYGKSVDIAAPSDSQTTTDNSGLSGYDFGDYTTSFGGTSGASPVIAGSAALVWSVNPDLTEEDVRTILYMTAKNLGNPVYYGKGRVVLSAAVAMAAGVEPGSLEGDDSLPPGGGGGGGGGPNSCIGSCGGQAAGGCYCDGECAQYGDCCADACETCGVDCPPGGGGGNPPPGGGGGGSEPPPSGGGGGGTVPPATGSDYPAGSCGEYVECIAACGTPACVSACGGKQPSASLDKADPVLACMADADCFKQNTAANKLSCASSSCAGVFSTCAADPGGTPEQPSDSPPASPDDGGSTDGGGFSQPEQPPVGGNPPSGGSGGGGGGGSPISIGTTAGSGGQSAPPMQDGWDPAVPEAENSPSCTAGTGDSGPTPVLIFFLMLLVLARWRAAPTE